MSKRLIINWTLTLLFIVAGLALVIGVFMEATR